MPDATGQSAAAWHHRDLARVSRRLHDRIGPSLCAAGLQLSVIEQSIALDPGSDTAEAIAGLREALAESTQEVRTLSYLCDPSLVARLGLKAAISYLARVVTLDPGDLGPLGLRKDEAAAQAFSILRQTVLYWPESCPGAEFTLEASPRALRLRSSLPAPHDVVELIRQSGGNVAEDRLSASLKVAAARGGSR
jgi:hypothetical protein